MSEGLFDIVFRGDIAPGQVLPQVKQRLAALFKRSAEQIEPLFSGAPVALKKDIDQASAEKYKKVLEQAGALVEIRAAGTLKAPVAKPRPTVKPEVTGSNVSSGVSTNASAEPSTMAEERADQRAQSRAEVEAEPHYVLSLAPADGYLLSDAERKQAQLPSIQVPNTHFDLRPLEGSLVDEHEIERMAPIEVADVSFDISEPGVELVDAEYREKVVPVVVADLDAQLAPAGTDLGQIAPEAPPPPPDTSALSLAD